MKNRRPCREIRDSETSEADDAAMYHYLRTISQTPLLTATEERALGRRIQAGDLSARHQMMTANLRLVIHIAKRYRLRDLPFHDLIAEGNLGLIRATDKFDPDKGFRFSTYAAGWIQDFIERALMIQTRTVHLPVNVQKTQKAILRKTSDLQRDLQRAPTAEEVADALEQSVATIRRCLEKGGQTVPLDPFGDPESVHDLITAYAATVADMVTDMAERDLHRKLHGWIADLPARHRQVVIQRFGLHDGEARTLEEVGIPLGIPRDRARQIEREALHILRARLTSERLDPETCFG